MISIHKFLSRFECFTRIHKSGFPSCSSDYAAASATSGDVAASANELSVIMTGQSSFRSSSPISHHDNHNSSRASRGIQTHSQRALCSEPEMKVEATPPLSLQSSTRRAVCLLLLYCLILISPWILTCILSRRPSLARSYHNQSKVLSKEQLSSVYFGVNTIRVLDSMATVAAVPVIGALLAHAAVVFTQRRREGKFRSVRQVFALADRAWAEVLVL